VRLISTRTPTPAEDGVSFCQAVLSAVAPDGGLFVPASPPDLRGVLAHFSRSTPFLPVAEAVAAALLDGEMDGEAIARVTRSAFPFEPSLHRLEEGLYLLELFHGPTCAFKDFGASFLAAIMEELLLQRQGQHPGGARQSRALILVATSGDTGSAAAQAFHGRRNIEVVILYPSGRVSALQEKQLTTVGDNVTALEVGGSFDDCQRLAKEAFLDQELSRELSLTSANSINPGRLFPQAFYYIHSFFQLPRRPGEPVEFCVPSGNFGNLTAGVYAWQWGLPVTGFLAATNVNDVVPEYLRTGVYRARPSRHTLSNAMDVGNPSNFERISQVFGGRVEAMRELIHGARINDAETRDTMRRVWEQRGRLLDPHTAVGVLAARRYRQSSGFTGSMIVLATAHPAKFADVVQEATGALPEIPASLREAMQRPKQAVPLAPRLEALKELLRRRYL
jgi:threonine synthase